MTVLRRAQTPPEQTPVYAVRMSHTREEAEKLVTWLEQYFYGKVQTVFHSPEGLPRQLMVGSNILVNTPEGLVRVHPGCYAVIYADGHLEDVPAAQFEKVGWTEVEMLIPDEKD